jgi:PHD/YefM family antitoxin component YafN of YafNO toxin-antitoxin module
MQRLQQAGRRKNSLMAKRESKHARKITKEHFHPAARQLTARKLYNTEEEEEEPPSAEKAQKPKRRCGGTLPSSDNSQEDT